MNTKNNTDESPYVRLRDLILRGEFDAGERLTEIKLAERLGVSRTPIRQALLEMAHAGLVEPVTGGGYMMRQFTSAEISDAMVVRGTLEGLAARVAAERGLTREQIAQLRAILADGDRVLAQQDESAVSGYALCNERFHHFIIQVSANTALQRAIVHNNGMPFAAPNAMLPVQSIREDCHYLLRMAHDQHHAIAEAILAREGTRAQALAEEHARVARRALDAALDAPGKYKELLPTLEFLSA